MRGSLIRQIFLAGILLAGGACHKDPPTKPVPPSYGSGILFSSSRDLPIWEIYSMRPDGSRVVRLTNDSLQDWQPRWSSDGKHIAFIRAYPLNSYPFAQNNLTVMDANGANPTRLTTDLGDESPSWSPDGSRISFVRSTSTHPELWTINRDGTSPTLIVDTLDVREISWTPQNKFLGVDGFGIVQFDADGTNRTHILDLTIGTVHDVYPQMSPDGTRIVFHWLGMYGSDSQIYVVNSDGSNLQPLTASTGDKGGAIWSPTGSRIAFSRSTESEHVIYTMNPDGSDTTRVTTGPEDYVGDWR